MASGAGPAARCARPWARGPWRAAIGGREAAARLPRLAARSRAGSLRRRQLLATAPSARRSSGLEKGKLPGGARCAPTVRSAVDLKKSAPQPNGRSGCGAGSLPNARWFGAPRSFRPFAGNAAAKKLIGCSRQEPEVERCSKKKKQQSLFSRIFCWSLSRSLRKKKRGEKEARRTAARSPVEAGSQRRAAAVGQAARGGKNEKTTRGAARLSRRPRGRCALSRPPRLRSWRKPRKTGRAQRSHSRAAARRLWLATR